MKDMISRRDILISGGVAGVALAAGGLSGSSGLRAQTAAPGGQMGTSTSGASSKGAPFTLPELRYGFDALQPHIDAKTMELHHGKHHLAYVEKLNGAIGKHPELTQMVLPELLANLDKVPEDVRQDIRNHGGGHANHTMFWSIMSPDGGRDPKGGIAAAINQGMGSLDALKQTVNTALRSILARDGCSWWSIPKAGRWRSSPAPTRTRRFSKAAACCLATTFGNTRFI